MSENFVPTKDRLLVKVIESEDKTASGIIYNPTDKPIKYGIVTSVGPQQKTISIGETVIFKTFASSFYDHHVILTEEEILAIVKE